MPKIKANIIERNDHNVSRKLISPNALKVIHRLNAGGFEAYLVGGGVRDIILGQQPKDFDIATSAHPEEVHELFKNSRLIGRRFKLVHILFGREVIEVATFRGSSVQESSASSKQSEQGMLLRDNVYGTIEDDAIRRDFTANALYYSPKNFCVLDFVDALNDMEQKTLRLIGEPEQRYREDPVRMLRAIRFKSKLGFSLEAKTGQAISESASLLQNVAAARLFDEVVKLFLSGYALDIFKDLVDFGLFTSLFPASAHVLESHKDKEFYLAFIQAGLSNTDKRIQQEKPVTPAFLYATALWPEVHRLWQQKMAEGESEFPAMQFASQAAISAQLAYITIPKRFSLMMKEIWEFQIRLKKTSGRWPKQLILHKRFRAGYDFLLLREQAGENLSDLGKWWTEFQVKHPVPKALPREHFRSKQGRRPDRSKRNPPPK